MDFLNLHTSETLRVVSHKSICGKDKLKFKSFFVIELKGRESCTEFFGIEPRWYVSWISNYTYKFYDLFT